MKENKNTPRPTDKKNGDGKKPNDAAFNNKHPGGTKPPAEKQAGGAGKQSDGKQFDGKQSDGKQFDGKQGDSKQQGGAARFKYADQIKGDMAVVCSDDSQLGVVDHLEGKNNIKLKKGDDGKHHEIPLSWVTSVDNEVHVDRSRDEAMQEWHAEE